MSNQYFSNLQRGWPTRTVHGVSNRPWPKADSSVLERYGRPLPTGLRIGMERISGVNLKDVRVYYNSSLPSQVQAHAYAQGRSIYLSPGQEHHLPHELGHVVQQAQGRVQPTGDVNGVPINDDPALEQEATELGERAMRLAHGQGNF